MERHWMPANRAVSMGPVLAADVAGVVAAERCCASTAAGAVAKTAAAMATAVRVVTVKTEPPVLREEWPRTQGAAGAENTMIRGSALGNGHAEIAARIVPKVLRVGSSWGGRGRPATGT